jgi:hypothetical protein
LPAIVGAAIAIVVLGLASKLFGGKFLFFLPQFTTAPGVAATWMPINRPSGLSFILDWAWNWPHFIVAAVSIFVLVVWKAPQEARASRARAVLMIQAAFVGLVFLLELFGLGLLRVSFNYVYLEIFTILAIGTLFGIALKDERTGRQLVVVAIMALLSACLLLSFRLDFVAVASIQRHGHGIAIAALALAMAAVLTKSGLQRVTAVSAAAAAWIVLNMALVNSDLYHVRGGAEARRSFLGFLAFSRSVNQFAPPEAKYWFDAYSAPVLSDRHRTGMARAFMAQAGTWLYGSHVASDAFPSLKHPYSGTIEIKDGDTIVALSVECSPPEIAEKALDAAGFLIKTRASRTFDFNGTPVCGDRMQITAKSAP